MPAQERVDYQAADCRVNSAAGTFVYNAGNYASILRTGVGVFEITLSPAMDPNEHTTDIQCIAASAGDFSANLELVSSTLYRVRTVSNPGAPVAADVDFYMSSQRVRTAN